MEPAPPAKPSHAKLIKQGWRELDRGNLVEARVLFGEALEAKPGSSDAHYGLAYAYEKLNNSGTAIYQYCQALRGGVDVGSRREIEGRLSALGGTCD